MKTPKSIMTVKEKTKLLSPVRIWESEKASQGMQLRREVHSGHPEKAPIPKTAGTTKPSRKTHTVSDPETDTSMGPSLMEGQDL